MRDPEPGWDDLAVKKDGEQHITRGEVEEIDQAGCQCQCCPSLWCRIVGEDVRASAFILESSLSGRMEVKVSKRNY